MRTIPTITAWRKRAKRSRRWRWAARLGWVGVLAFAALAPRPAPAQLLDLNRMALEWLRGRFVSPVVCDVGGEALRTVRRVIVSPGPRHARPPVDRVSFHGVEVKEARRCADAMGVEAPDVRGALHLTLPGRPRPDLAQAEFHRALRQTGGFDYEVTEGRLQLTGWGEGATPERVDFAGGKARVREVQRGSDAARILQDFAGRKITLDLEAPTGETLSFHLVLYDFR